MALDTGKHERKRKLSKDEKNTLAKMTWGTRPAYKSEKFTNEFLKVEGLTLSEFKKTDLYLEMEKLGAIVNDEWAL